MGFLTNLVEGGFGYACDMKYFEDMQKQIDKEFPPNATADMYPYTGKTKKVKVMEDGMEVEKEVPDLTPEEEKAQNEAVQAYLATVGQIFKAMSTGFKGGYDEKGNFSYLYTEDKRPKGMSAAALNTLQGALDPAGGAMENITDLGCRKFAADMDECFMDFLGKAQDRDVERELPEYAELTEKAASDYGSGNYGYPAKSKAKLACREALRSAVSHAGADYRKEKDAMVEGCRRFLSGAEGEIFDFIRQLQESIRDYVSLDFEEEEKQEAVLEACSDILEGNELTQLYAGLDMMGSFDILIKEIFDSREKNILDADRYLGLCSYEEDDGKFCFEMENAVEELNDKLEDFYSEACENMKEGVADLYHAVTTDFCRIAGEYFLELLGKIY